MNAIDEKSTQDETSIFQGNVMYVQIIPSICLWMLIREVAWIKLRPIEIKTVSYNKRNPEQ